MDKFNIPYDAEEEEELYHEMLSVASANECTGLIPASPITSSEAASYKEIYDIPLAIGKETKSKEGHTNACKNRP